MKPMFVNKSKKWSGLRTVALVLVLASTGSEAQENAAPAFGAKGINEASRLLAGMPMENPGSVRELAGTAVWKTHAEAMEQQWSRYERSTLKPMEEWSTKEIASRVKEGAVVRYMFSGPDILHAARIFPQAGTFIMAGLEPVGEAPDLGKMSAKTLARPLAEVRKALEEIIQFSFFKTIDMKVDLSQATFRGTLPIMCLFLARSGIEIELIEYLKLAEDGSVTSQGTVAAGADAVRLTTAMDSAMNRKTIYYFQTDISNGNIKKSGFLKFLESKEAGVSYVKAASYLMHNSYFSEIRDHLLAYSGLLVEDDSGIPLRHFKPGEWQIGFYGTYSSPIPLFQEHFQADLRKAYQEGAAKALDFGTGYRWRKNDSNLLVASRVPESPAAQAVAIVKTALDPVVEITAVSPEAPAESSPLVADATPTEPVGDPVGVKPEMRAAIPVEGPAEVAVLDTPQVPVDPAPTIAAAIPEPSTVATQTGEVPASTPPNPGAEVEMKVVSDGPVEITLKLVRKPDLSELGELNSNALAVFEYEVVSVQRGEYPYKTMRLADGIVWGGKVSALGRREIGATISLEVVPLRQYPNLEKMRRIDTLGQGEGLPIFAPSL
jgi:hypothetical protein